MTEHRSKAATCAVCAATGGKVLLVSSHSPDQWIDCNHCRNVEHATSSVIDALRPLPEAHRRKALLNAMAWWLDGTNPEDR